MGPCCSHSSGTCLTNTLLPTPQSCLFPSTCAHLQICKQLELQPSILSSVALQNQACLPQQQHFVHCHCSLAQPLPPSHTITVQVKPGMV